MPQNPHASQKTPSASLTQYSDSISYIASFYMKLCGSRYLKNRPHNSNLGQNVPQYLTQEYQQKLDQSYFLGGKMAFHNLQLQFLCGFFI